MKEQISDLEWRPCHVSDMYEVSEYGHVRLAVDRNRYKAGHVLSSNSVSRRGGYPTMRFLIDGRRKWFYVHTLVLTAFAGPRPKGMQCAHGDGNPRNNHISNLRWATPAENAADRVRHGRHRNGYRKLSADQVRRIRERREQGASYAELCADHNVSMGNMSAIINRQTWDYI